MHGERMGKERDENKLDLVCPIINDERDYKTTSSNKTRTKATSLLHLLLAFGAVDDDNQMVVLDCGGLVRINHRA